MQCIKCKRMMLTEPILNCTHLPSVRCSVPTRGKVIWKKRARYNERGLCAWAIYFYTPVIKGSLRLFLVCQLIRFVRVNASKGFYLMREPLSGCWEKEKVQAYRMFTPCGAGMKKATTWTSRYFCGKPFVLEHRFACSVNLEGKIVFLFWVWNLKIYLDAKNISLFT